MDSSTRKRSSTVTKLCFIEEEDAETEAVFPINNNKILTHIPIYYNGFQRRSGSLRNLESFQGYPSSKTVNGRFFHQEQPPPHFLDSCFICMKSLGDRDIFMYRGDTPFCSEECRQEQIDMDEAREKSWNSSKALRKKEQTPSSSPNKTSQTYRFRSNTVVAG